MLFYFRFCLFSFVFFLMCFGVVLCFFVDEFWQYVISLEFVGFSKLETDMKSYVLVNYEFLKNAEKMCSFPNHYLNLPMP